ncbi:AcrR family transcriptional regulator [Mycetocola sp. CAN_C7]|uniref:TetR/AcrR family transcriptional regulator n=1 Tax=Mycetocola sp. CAN_C7 TaxID=2787724 RepID=UPI0018CB5074
MSRPVDREKYESKRSAIVRAASGQFATHGYQRSTTAGICREAGISSGTFFHYFGSKLEALVAVLESGCEDLRTHLTNTEQAASGLAAVMSYATAVAAEMGEDSYPIFVAGLAGVESEPRVAAALETESGLVTEFLARNVETGQQRGEIREDVPALELTRWVSWLLDGASQAAAMGESPQASQVHGGVRAILESSR